jgi:hypothetical protein
MADDRLARIIVRAEQEGPGPHEWAWKVEDVRWLAAEVATSRERIAEALSHHQPTGENLGTGAPYCTCDDLTDYPCPTRQALEGTGPLSPVGMPAYPWVPTDIKPCGCGWYMKGKLTDPDVKHLKFYCSMGHYLDD